MIDNLDVGLITLVPIDNPCHGVQIHYKVRIK